MRAAPSFGCHLANRRMIPPHKGFWHSTTELTACSLLLAEFTVIAHRWIPAAGAVRCDPVGKRDRLAWIAVAI